MLWNKGKKEEKEKASKNKDFEDKIVSDITTNQSYAESVRGTAGSGNATNVDQVWEDENKMLVGDQWDTEFAKRKDETKKARPNSVDNFIHPAIMGARANITASVPEVTVEGMEMDTQDGDDDYTVAEKVTHAIKFNDKRNNFRATWKRMVQQFLSFGPVIGAVLWDGDWLGGTGPNRWVGDVRILNLDRREVFFDPAIIDRETRLQECGFIHRKIRKKIAWIKQKWGKDVAIENNTNTLQDEGSDHDQAYLIEAWERGKPRYIPDEWKKTFEQKARDLLPPSMTVDYYKAKDYEDMAKGILEGIHCTYVANGVFLEYKPYVYEDGLYPFVYKVLYFDENKPDGYGEIKNIKMPQVIHNKVDEIQIGAFAKRGLGNQWVQEGALTKEQKADYVNNAGRGGRLFEIANINMIRDEQGIDVPPGMDAYKEQKQRIIETVSANTPIQQGMAPGANMPYKAIAELGARTDTRTKDKVEILEDFLIELNRLRINRFLQFYTEDRYYRIKGTDGKPISGSINANSMYNTWNREEMTDDMGNITGYKQERYVPEFDLTIKIMDEKPTDRNYYTNVGLNLYGQQAMDLESLWYTLEEGKFPPKKEILERLKSQNMGLQMADMLSKMPPEAAQMLIQNMQQMMQQMTMNSGGQNETKVY